MRYFNNITNIKEGQLIYRRLAMLNHPDLGGNPNVMKKINIEFDIFKKRIKNPNISFRHLKVDDYVIINLSRSKIVSLSRNTFIARSESTNREAVFSRDTGICIVNPKFKAENINKLENVS